MTKHKTAPRPRRSRRVGKRRRSAIRVAYRELDRQPQVVATNILHDSLSRMGLTAPKFIARLVDPR